MYVCIGQKAGPRTRLLLFLKLYRFLSKDKYDAVITVFFFRSTNCFDRIHLPLIIVLIEASQFNAFLQEYGFYLTLKGFINHNHTRYGASLKKIR